VVVTQPAGARRAAHAGGDTVSSAIIPCARLSAGLAGEDPMAENMRGRHLRGGLTVLVAFGLALTAACGGGEASMGSLTTGLSTTILVPDVTLQPAEDARRVMELAGLRVDTIDVPGPETQAGLVVEQVPAAGTIVASGTRVALRVATVEASTTTGPETTATTVGIITTSEIPTTATATTRTAISTTTAAPFYGTVEDKTGPTQGSPAGRLIDIRSWGHPGFARVVFDFAPGGVPSYWIGYTGATTLTVLLSPMYGSPPYDAGIFVAWGTHSVGAGNIVAVEDVGMGAGSGEWIFDIVVTDQTPFLVGTFADPPRIYVDVGD
jgi:hypothetical protein